MSTKHPAEVLSYRCEQALLEYELPATVEQLMQDCADMLREEQKPGSRHDLQAHGKHPAPCARFCEATAFRIEISSLTAERDKLMDRHNALHVNAAALRAEVLQWQRSLADQAAVSADLRAEVEALSQALRDISVNSRDSYAQETADQALALPCADVRAVVDAFAGGPAAPPARPKSLDDPHLQRIFSDVIRGALALGAGNECPPPVGHWLGPWWEQGRAVAAAADPVAQPARELLTDEEIRAALASITHEVPSRLPLGWEKFGRAVERACSARWGVRLEGGAA